MRATTTTTATPQKQQQQQQQQHAIGCCSCVSCECGSDCTCTETLCRCEASSVLNSLSLDHTMVTAAPTTLANSPTTTPTTTMNTTTTTTTPSSPPSSSSSSSTTWLVEYKVKGMRCSACVRKIQQLVVRRNHDTTTTATTPSIVAVDLKRGLVVARVSHHDQATKLLHQIQQLGFESVEMLVLEPTNQKNTTTTNENNNNGDGSSSSSKCLNNNNQNNNSNHNNKSTVVVAEDKDHRKQQQQPISQQEVAASEPQLQQQQQHRVEIMVGGMTCTMCSKAVTSALQKLTGVNHVSVSLATHLATIDYHDNTTTNNNNHNKSKNDNNVLSQIQEAIENIGYTVEQVMLNVNDTTKDQQETSTNTTMPQSLPSSATTTLSSSSSPERRFQMLQQQQEQQMLRRKRDFLWSLVATLPILLLTMILPHVLSSTHPILTWLNQSITIFHHDFQRESFILWLLATPVQFICGWTFYQRAYYNILQNQLGMDVLVVLGTTASYGYALAGTIGYGNKKTHQHHDDHNVDDGSAHFFETSAVLICFVLLGKWMNALAVRRTSDALTQLMKLQAKTALRVITTKNINNKIQNDNENESSLISTSPPQKREWNPSIDPYDEQVVPIEMIQAGDIVKVIRGASIPADGIVLHGEMTVDESMITGESVPVLKTTGSMVLGGTICVESAAASTTTITTSDKTAKSIVAANANSSSSSAAATTTTTTSVGAAFCVVTGVGSSTALAQIVQLVQDAQTRQVPIQNFADTISAIFVPTVATISLVTFLVWYALCNTGVVPESWYQNLEETTSTFSLMFGVACLVISCPCALGLATPTAIMVGTGVGAKHGVLLKGGEALEMASKVNSVVFDKTGTLTKGKPEITNYHRLAAVPLRAVSTLSTTTATTTTESSSSSDSVVAAVDESSCCGKHDNDDDLFLWLMASLERNSEHPLAAAVVAYANEKISSSYLEMHPYAQPTNFRALTGRGTSGTIAIRSSQAAAAVAASHTLTKGEDDGVGVDADCALLQLDVAVGNRAFCTLMNIAIPPSAETKMTEFEEQGKTAILTSVNNQVCAVLGIADELKPDAGAAISYLRTTLSMDVWMVTGDNRRTANAIARRLNLPSDRVISEALPVAKVQRVRRLQNSGRIVAMVGDGVNDSPALAQADVGMSLGTGAEIAAEASDMVLVRGHVSDVCTALNLSRVIFRRIQWNFVWSLVYNCLGIPVAAGVFFPLIRTRLPPTVAALAMALSSLSVVSSSLALRFYKPPKIVATTTQQQQQQHSRLSVLQTMTQRISWRSTTRPLSSTEQQDDLTVALLNHSDVNNEPTSRRLDDVQSMEEGGVSR